MPQVAHMVNRRDERSRHEQIAAELRERILSGDLAPGDQLPSTSRLVESYGAANVTIQNALKALKAEGLLVGQAGKGVWVRQRGPHTINVGPYFQPEPGGYSYTLLHVGTEHPPADVRQALSLDADGTAVLRKRLMHHADLPVEIDWSWYPHDIADGTPLIERKKMKGGAPRVLAEAGVPQRYFVDHVTSRPPTTEEIETLDLPESVSVTRQFRVIYTDGGRPVEVTLMIKGSHRYELAYRVEIE